MIDAAADNTLKAHRIRPLSTRGHLLKSMSLIQLAVAQLIAAAIGIALQLSSSGRARAAIFRVGGRRILGGGVGLIVALALWDTICIFVKLFTWKPFAGDAPGSVEATAVLCLAGSAVAGFFASKWIFRPPLREEPPAVISG